MTYRGLRARGDFLIKLAGAIVMMAIGDWLFWQGEQSGGILGVYALILLAGAVLCRRAIRRDWRALGCIALAAIAAFAMIIDPGPLAWCLFWAFAGMGTLIPATARFDNAWAWGQRLVLHALRSSIAPLLDLFRMMRVRKQRKAQAVRQRLAPLGLPLIGSAIIIALFAAANPVIEQNLNALLDFSWLRIDLGRMILWTLLLTAGWSLLRPRLKRPLLGTFDGHGDLPLAGVSVASVRLSLIAFNALFALQNMMDLAWLWGLMPLPKGISLADYAHRGAYPLIVTALLAALFVLVALRPGSQTAAVPAIRRMVVLWVAQNLLLVANAAVRTLDYIAAFSLTSLRMAALLWMALVALGLILTCWRLLTAKSSSWLINANATAAMTLLIACSFVDLDAVAARYNVEHAREAGGDGAPIDLCYLQNMGSSGLLPLADLEHRRTPEAIHLSARLLRENAQARLMDDQATGNWSLLGAWRLTALRRHYGADVTAAQDRYLADCATRDVHKLRVALGLERPTPPPPAPTAAPAAARAALTPAPAR